MSNELSTAVGSHRADVTLTEHSTSDPLDLSEQDRHLLRSEINDGGERLSLSYTTDGRVRIHTGSYVGIVSLPDGPTIEVVPKVPGANLLFLLRYAYDVSGTTYDYQTPIAPGKNFQEALATIFETELQHILTRGLAKGYRTVERQEDYLRGQLDVQRQLQRQGPQATKFECTYDELTHDIPLNRAVLYATSLLAGVVSDRTLGQRLKSHELRLRQSVSLTPVEAHDLAELETSRLTTQYQNILPLVELVITNTFAGDFRAGSSTSFSLLVNMNTVFEKVVERAFREVIESNGEITAVRQKRTGDLLTGGKYSAHLKPDVAYMDSLGEIVFVGDAKWKTGDPSNEDFYQIAAYQQAHDCPGALIYPEQEASIETAATLPTGQETHLVELPTGGDHESYDEFVTALTERTRDAVSTIVGAAVVGTATPESDVVGSATRGQDSNSPLDKSK